MKRIFNQYMSSYKPRFDTIGELTTMFNHWVSQKYTFKAYTNKFMVMRWLLVYDLPF